MYSIIVYIIFILWAWAIYNRIRITKYIRSKQKLILFLQLGLSILGIIASVFLDPIPSFGLSAISFGLVSLSSIINRVSIVEFIVWPFSVRENQFLMETRAVNVGIIGVIICVVMGITVLIYLYLY